MERPDEILVTPIIVFDKRYEVHYNYGTKCYYLVYGNEITEHKTTADIIDWFKTYSLEKDLVVVQAENYAMPFCGVFGLIKNIKMFDFHGLGNHKPAVTIWYEDGETVMVSLNSLSDGSYGVYDFEDYLIEKLHGTTFDL